MINFEVMFKKLKLTSPEVHISSKNNITTIKTSNYFHTKLQYAVHGCSLTSLHWKSKHKHLYMYVYMHISMLMFYSIRLKKFKVEWTLVEHIKNEYMEIVGRKKVSLPPHKYKHELRFSFFFTGEIFLPFTSYFMWESWENNFC